MVLRGREVYYCPECGWFHPPNGFTGMCPRCSRPLFALFCSRCGHSWRTRSDKLPRTCPRCKSPYWNRARIPQEQKRRRAKLYVSEGRGMPSTDKNTNYDEEDTHDGT